MCRRSVASALASAFALACSEPNPQAQSTAPLEKAAPPENTATALSDSLFGVVSMQNGAPCLAAAVQSWPESDTILVVIPTDQRSVRATVGQPISQCGYEAPSPGVAFYQLNALGSEPGAGIAILARGVHTLGNARTDIDQDGTPETYRSCTSSEGLHLTVWAGEPLRGRRVWHHYYYLGYDVEPTCVEADWVERK